MEFIFVPSAAPSSLSLTHNATSFVKRQLLRTLLRVRGGSWSLSLPKPWGRLARVKYDLKLIIKTFYGNFLMHVTVAQEL